jgi:hypothetical protein
LLELLFLKLKRALLLKDLVAALYFFVSLKPLMHDVPLHLRNGHLSLDSSDEPVCLSLDCLEGSAILEDDSVRHVQLAAVVTVFCLAGELLEQPVEVCLFKFEPVSTGVLFVPNIFDPVHFLDYPAVQSL